MNKKLKELLDKINSKKAEVTDLAENGKLDEAEKAKAELVDLQKQFDILKDVLPEEQSVTPENKTVEPERITEPVSVPKNVHVVQTKNHDAIHEFANAARHLFMNVDKTSNEGTGADGGYVVPQDIQTLINKFKEAEFDLTKFADTENVTTNSGRRTYQTRAQLTGFTQVGEGAKIAQVDGPQFSILEYNIKKYAGFLPVTNELLNDSDQNITNVITQWIAKQDVATRNSIILAILKQITPTAITGYKDIKKAVNVTLGSKYAGSVAIYTNDDGLNYLDTEFVDKNDRSLVTPDLQTPMQMVFAAGGQKLPIRVIPNEILTTDTTTTKGSSIIPVFIGDLKEAAKLFDRQKVTITNSNVAVAGNFNAFDQDMTLFRAIDRLDAVQKDAAAMVYGQITVKDSTPAA